MAIRFKESDARPMGRNASGVKGIKLMDGDYVVGMVRADPEAQLLTVCAHGYGKRTPFGPNLESQTDEPHESDDANADHGGDDETQEYSSQRSYRTQSRGGKGLRDIKTTDRNGSVIGIVSVTDADELLMISAQGKLQRVAAADISVVGRNTQGVRIMWLADDDHLVAVKRIPADADNGETEE
jgi:DNA gyrase subunit A